MRCQRQRKRSAESRSLRTAILAMFADRFSEEEIALGLECEISEVVAVLVSDKRQRDQQQRIAERIGWIA